MTSRKNTACVLGLSALALLALGSRRLTGSSGGSGATGDPVASASASASASAAPSAAPAAVVPNPADATGVASCDAYLAAYRCFLMKSGMAPDNVDKTVAQMRDTYKAQGANMAVTCDAAAHAMQAQAMSKGCVLPSAPTTAAHAATTAPTGSAPPAAAVIAPAPGDREDVKDVASVLAEIQAARNLPAQTPKAQLAEAMGVKFGHWGRVMSTLSAEGRDADADRVAQALVDLRNAWGKQAMGEVDSFARDSFQIGPYVVRAAQFFEPTPMDPGSSGPQIDKLYRFSVYEGQAVVFRYYLEYSNIMGAYYVLTRQRGGEHAEIQPYGERAPAYRAMRDRVIADMQSSR
jgi:hypothetical protein